MSVNTRLFFAINNLAGRNKFFDAFSKMGAELSVIIMIGWYGAASFINGLPSKRLALWPIVFLGAAWSLGWIINMLLGMIVRKPRPYITHPQTKLLFHPLMSWKSFPSDHSMSAFLMVCTAYIFALPYAWALIPLALWVGWGRVYAGVHYPLDILAGWGVAGVASLVVYYMAFV